MRGFVLLVFVYIAIFAADSRMVDHPLDPQTLSPLGKLNVYMRDCLNEFAPPGYNLPKTRTTGSEAFCTGYETSAPQKAAQWKAVAKEILRKSQLTGSALQQSIQQAVDGVIKGELLMQRGVPVPPPPPSGLPIGSAIASRNPATVGSVIATRGPAKGSQFVPGGSAPSQTPPSSLMLAELRSKLRAGTSKAQRRSEVGDAARSQSTARIPWDSSYLSKWPNAVVWYTWDPATLNDISARETGRQDVAFAMNYVEENTCFRFRYLDPGVKIQPAPSTVCHIQSISQSGFCTGSADVFNVGAGGCSHGTAIHELGHVLGFHHVFSQANRDLYVTINRDNFDNVTACAPPGCTFDSAYGIKSAAFTRPVPIGFDYMSIMGYPRNAFAKPGTIVMDEKAGHPNPPPAGSWPPGATTTGLFRGTFSPTDASEFNSAYSCTPELKARPRSNLFIPAHPVGINDSTPITPSGGHPEDVVVAAVKLAKVPGSSEYVSKFSGATPIWYKKEGTMWKWTPDDPKGANRIWMNATVGLVSILHSNKGWANKPPVLENLVILSRLQYESSPKEPGTRFEDPLPRAMKLAWKRDDVKAIGGWWIASECLLNIMCPKLYFQKVVDPTNPKVDKWQWSPYEPPGPWMPTNTITVTGGSKDGKQMTDYKVIIENFERGFVLPK